MINRDGGEIKISGLPVIVFLMLALLGLQVQLLLKLCLAAIVGLPLCFGITCLIRKIPYAKKIL